MRRRWGRLGRLIDATDVEAVVREGACALLARELEGGRKERVETASS